LVQNNRYQGKLKFYDQNGKYGFIIVDGIGSDLFVHLDDLSKAGITKDNLEQHSMTK
jgi:cold shock CspA family protein